MKLGKTFHKDLNWFARFLREYNGISFFDQEKEAEYEIFLDACLEGMGAFCENQVHSTDIKGLLPSGLSIVHYEMLNIVVTLRLWCQWLRRKKVKIHCDNMAAVMVCKTGKTRDNFLGTCYRNLWLICALFDIDLEVVHIEGKKNVIADVLSRINLKKQVNRSVVEWLYNECVWWRVPIEMLKLNECL